MNTEHWWNSDRKLLAVPLRQSQIARGLPSNQVLLQLQCKTYFSSADGGRTLWKVNNPPTRLSACHNPEHLQTSIVKTSNLASKTNHYTRIKTVHPSIPKPIAKHRSVTIRQYLRALFQTRESWYRCRCREPMLRVGQQKNRSSIPRNKWFYSKAYRPVLGPPTLTGSQGLFPRMLSGRSVKLNTHLHLRPR